MERVPPKAFLYQATAGWWARAGLGSSLLLLAGLAKGQGQLADSTTRPAQDLVLTGQVVSVSQVPIAGATLWLKGTSVITSTNADGKFLLRPTTPGPYTLQVEAARFVRAETVTNGQGPILIRLYPLVRR
ncbi:carboxypeptidase regulatory-like domain-containing protein [Hymenobacter sediminis]|uniref:carboxypeptidase regulatory-like domain-containing protein n=1 Tax=Hymenobacter sediminis TaxID=2218621 RepID=UPI00138FBF99|nr:carboxypeptidase regulatory-like domain-containing protein [Hymenobacter sediminis]